jgi:DNA-binding LacI/PurR family transcriptional regulator
VKRPTIKDVAARAGVSKSTVSNVVRSAGSMSPDTRERVEEAIRALGYRPHAAARNLVQQRTNLLGVVVGDLANAFNAELVKHLEQQASRHDYTTLVCNTDGNARLEATRIEALLEQRVDGIALLEFSGDRTVIAQLLAERVPVVMISCAADYSDYVAVDDYAGIALGVAHLVELGHSRIAHAVDALGEPAMTRTRLDAFERAILRHGLQVRAEWLLAWDRDAAGERAVEAVFAAEPAPTAVLAANDFTAMRLIELLEARGRRVPQDVSVVGFDGIAIGGLSRLALTTVAQPREQLAAVGMRTLLVRIEGGPEAPGQQRRLAPRLVVRGSTAAPACG